MNIFKTKSQVTVAEIHDTFFTEVDRLLEEANIKVSESTDKDHIITKANRLEKLGFGKSKTVDVAKEEKKRLEEATNTNIEKDRLQRAIEYFSVKYPMYKFITEESIKKICEKYGLIYGEVQYFKGDVPDKNLEQIEKFKIHEEDCAYWNVTRWSFGRDKKEASFEDVEKRREREESDRKYYESLDDRQKIALMSLRSSMYRSDIFEKMSLEIAAPKDDFDIDNMDIKDFKLSKIEVPDPVVFHPVMFEETKYYLIVTAWGDEASDELVVNNLMN